MSTPDDDWMDNAHHDPNPFSGMDDRPQPTLRAGGSPAPKSGPSTTIVIAISVTLVVVVAVSIVVSYQLGASSCIPSGL